MYHLARFLRAHASLIGFGLLVLGASALSLSILDQETPSAGSSASSPTLAGSSLPGGVLQGKLSAAGGSSTSQTFAFDQNASVSGQALLHGKGARFTMSGPSGPLILGDLVTQDIGKDTVVQTFTLSSPPTGTITTELTAGTTSAATLQYSLEFSNGRGLVVEPRTFMPEPNAAVHIRACVRDQTGRVVKPDPAGSHTASVAVTPTDTKSHAIQLFDDGAHEDESAGDGVFGGSITSPALAGRYSLDGHVAIAVGAEIIERTTHTPFVVPSKGAEFTRAPAVAVGSKGTKFASVPTESTPDADKDGRLDALVLSQPVSFAKNGMFRVVATLVDGTGVAISHLQANYTNTQGKCEHPIVLSAPGSEIVRHGVDGPWILRERKLFDLDAGSLRCDSAPDFSTKAHLASAFERPPRPNVSMIVPNSGSLLGGDDAVIHGSGFVGVTSVLIGANAATFIVRGDDVIQVTLPRYATDLPRADPGKRVRIPVDVKVIGPWGSATSWGGFTYEE